MKDEPETAASAVLPQQPLKEEQLLEYIRSLGLPSDIILNNAADAVLQIDRDGRILRANPIATVTLSYSEEELQDRNVFDLIPGEYHPLLTDRLSGADSPGTAGMPGNREDLFAFRFRCGKERWKTFEGVVLPYREEDRTTSFLNLWPPESENHLATQLKEAQSNFESLTETISEAVVIIDESFKILYANTATVRVFGYRKEELTGTSFEQLFPREVFYRYAPEIRKFFHIDFDSPDNADIKRQIELLGCSKNRGVSPLEISFGNSRDIHEKTLTCIVRDISQRKNVERKLRYLAYHDKLTELGNRDLFNTDLDNQFELFRKNPELTGALFFLDLDGFKQINDTLGHQAGDELLIETAGRLRSILRETDFIYRFGGDEFVILLNRIHHKNDVDVVAAKILSEIGRPYLFEKDHQTIPAKIGVSIGIALIPDHGTDRGTITRNADLAMYSAKENGKNRHVIFSSALTRSARDKWVVEQGLKTALVNGEMFLEYQPMVSGEGEICGVEALIRWNHPEQGIIPPAKFIPAAEESGTVIPLGHWVLENACTAIRSLNSRLNRNLFVSVNISTKQLGIENFPDTLDGVISRTGIPAENLRLEVKETCLMEFPEKAINTLLRLKKMHPGLKLVIDDFGTGYSSLNFLSRLPVDSIKIDRAFIRSIPDPGNRKIINAISTLARSLNLETVAEGIETEEQRNYPPLEDCRYYQGFLISRPQDAASLESLLTDRARQP